MICRCTFQVLLLAVAVLAASSLEYDPLDQLDELAPYPAFLRGLRKYRRHWLSSHRHHQRHRGGRHLRHLALMHPFPADISVAAPDLDLNLDGTNAVQPSPTLDDIKETVRAAIYAPKKALPARHPAVETALERMPGDLQTLKDKANAAKEARNELEGSLKNAFNHMNNAMSIKHAISQKEVQMRVEEKREKALEQETSRIERTHSSLVNSLHRVLEPKIMVAKERLLKKERNAEEEDQVTAGWNKKKEEMKQQALELIKERHAAKDSLLEAHAAVEEAKRKEDMAHKKFEQKRQMATHGIQGYKYSVTRFDAEVNRDHAVHEAASAAKASVKRLNDVLAEEEHRVDETMVRENRKVQQRMQKIKSFHERSSSDLTRLRGQFKEWQMRQRARAAVVLKNSQFTAKASEEFEAHEQQVLNTAHAQAVKKLVANDWAHEDDSDYESEFSPDEAMIEEDSDDDSD